MMLTVKADLMGALSIAGQDPEIMQTGYGILSGLMRIIANSQ